MKVKDGNIKKFEAFIRKPVVSRYNFLPIRVCLYLTRACNLSCPNCTYSDNEYFRKASFLTIEQFQTILDATHDYAISYAMAGGEPLLNKDFLKFTRMVRDVPNATATINTNGLLLHKYMDEICESNIWRIQVSFDAYDDAGYQRERHGKPGDFDKLCNNVRELLKTRGKRSEPSVAISFLLHKGNFTEIPNMIAFAEDIGVDQVGFHNVNNHMDESMVPLRRDDREVIELLDKVMKKKYRLGILLPPLISNEFNICPMPFKDIYINDAMEINPCCHVMDYTFSKFDGTLEQCWRTEKLDRFRQDFMNKRLPHANCKNCHRRFNFYGSYDRTTGWLKDDWKTRGLRKIIKYSPEVHRLANTIRRRLNSRISKSG